jgi:2-polyprenyl-3-methyl-5-hydroxy-6-metoxy-1,4-benzoquinol methylase
MDRVDQLLSYMEEKHPRLIGSVREAEQVDPIWFRRVTNQLLEWSAGVVDGDGIQVVADGYAQFNSDVNWAQGHYEVDGEYENKSYTEVYESHYNQKETMEAYLWGVCFANVLRPHHVELGVHWETRFLSRLQNETEIIEIAPGHGAWGLLALDHVPGSSLRGFDISETSVATSRAMAHAAGLSSRTSYEVRDALDLERLEPQSADAVICSFVLEHLEEPEKIFAATRHLLRTDGVAFITGGLESAQVDHIYEFHRESELVVMAESQGCRVLETASFHPSRNLRNARFLPRSMTLIVCPSNET